MSRVSLIYRTYFFPSYNVEMKIFLTFRFHVCFYCIQREIEMSKNKIANDVYFLKHHFIVSFITLGKQIWICVALNSIVKNWKKNVIKKQHWRHRVIMGNQNRDVVKMIKSSDSLPLISIKKRHLHFGQRKNYGA